MVSSRYSPRLPTAFEWSEGHGADRIKIVDVVTSKIEMIPEIR
jgi:hypothetical protein